MHFIPILFLKVQTFSYKNSNESMSKVFFLSSSRKESFLFLLKVPDVIQRYVWHEWKFKYFMQNIQKSLPDMSDQCQGDK